MATSRETSLGGREWRFPSTRWSLILGARDRASPAYREALNDLCRLYWKPVYAYIRAARRVTNEEAKDLTQDFLLEVVEGGMLERFEEGRGTFRSYVHGALRLFLLKSNQKAMTLKRGGGRIFLSFEGDDHSWMEHLPSTAEDTPEEIFDRQWARSVIDHAVADLEKELLRQGRRGYFELFDRYEIHPPEEKKLSHADLAQEFGLKTYDVCNHLMYCRRHFRRFVVARTRETVTNKGDLDSELRRIVGLLRTESL